MIKTLDQLISAYDRGACSRRQLLTALATLGLGGSAAAGAQPSRPGTSVARINHINLRVSDVGRSVEFYQRLFGPGFRQFATMLPYDLGGGAMVPYMSIQSDKDVATEGRTQYTPIWHRSLTTEPGTWEHIAFEVDDLDVDAMMATLADLGVETSIAGGIIWTHDPDGALIQILDAKARAATMTTSLEPITPEDVTKHD